jgi:predicted nucleic acid-binding protein
MIFIDTGAFVARHLARDQYHETAAAGWKQLARRGWPCLTTSFVLDEVVTLLARRAGAGFAAERARAILTSERLTVIRPDADDELVALEILEKFEDKDLSYTDCISFVTMRARGIRRAFTFDRHFRDAGFVLWPPGSSRR